MGLFSNYSSNKGHINHIHANLADCKFLKKKFSVRLRHQSSLVPSVSILLHKEDKNQIETAKTSSIALKG